MMARQTGSFDRERSAVLENRVVWGLLAIATVLTVRSIVKQARQRCLRTVLGMRASARLAHAYTKHA